MSEHLLAILGTCFLALIALAFAAMAVIAASDSIKDSLARRSRMAGLESRCDSLADGLSSLRKELDELRRKEGA